MPLRNQLHKAISTLLAFQNYDGGIPAVLPGQNSGAWTTASCLESFLLCAYVPPNIFENCKKMIDFLLSVQLPDGGWPYVNTPPVSTLSTGHTLSSLILAMKYVTDQVLLEKLKNAIDLGLKWILDNQNSDGGWGVQPSLGKDGKSSRISGTYYAMRPFWMKGETYKDSDVVNRGASLLLSLQRPDGGWPYVQGSVVDNESDVSNTSRAVLALLRSGNLIPESNEVRRAVEFITSQKIKGLSWRLGVEGFSYTSPTITLYHNNSPCDALEALVCANCFDDATKEAFAWLLLSQRDDGIWELKSPDTSQHGLERAWTWSTSEFIHVINLVSKNYLKYEVDKIISSINY